MISFLDFDGVILGRDPATRETALASNASAFLKVAVACGPVYWLTTWCRNEDRVLDHIQPYADELFTHLAVCVRPARWDVMKTEAIERLAPAGDFVWLDDSPMQAERASLAQRGWTNNLIEVNTRERFDDLVKAERLMCERVATLHRKR